MKKPKILLADDEEKFVKMAKMQIEAFGYEVITACDGEKAIEKVKNESPAAVLLDIKMPKKDGIEVLREIRRFNKKLPVIMLTALKIKEPFAESKELGIGGYIIKTEDLATQLKSSVRTILKLSTKRRSKHGDK